MNYKLVKFNKSRALLPCLKRGLWVFLLLAFLPSAAFADFTVTYVLDITTNSPGGDFGWEQAQIKANARWGVYDDPVTNINGYTTPALLDSPPDYFVILKAMANYYIPTPQAIDLLVNTNITYYYAPYSNSLAVTIAGITTTTNVTWTLTGPTEFTNSANYGTIFTNTFPGSTPNTRTIASIPTGNYSVAFSTLSGYTFSSANPQSTNIVNASPAVNSLMGTYVRLTGTIQVNVSPTNGSWAFTSWPSDYTNYTSSGLSSTNNATGILTNAPVGSYTIEFLPTMGYDLPTPSTVTKTSSSLLTTTFEGIYVTGYRLTVHVMTIVGHESGWFGVWIILYFAYQLRCIRW